MFICRICGKSIGNKGIASHIHHHNMTSKSYYDIYLKTELDGHCLTCGQSTEFKSILKGYLKHCSNRCSQLDPTVIKKKAKTCLNKFGATNVYASDYGKQKIKETMLYKYGVESSLQLDTVREKTYESMRLDKTKSKIQSTRQTNITEYEQAYNCTQLIKIDNQYGQGWRCLHFPVITIGKETVFLSNEYLPIIDYCHTHNGSFVQNYIDYSIQQVYSGEIIRNSRKILDGKYELDIYLPTLKLAIEYNGIYWHAVENGCAIDYHTNKSIACREKNVRLIHIYEFENISQQIILLQKFILGIDAYHKNDFNKNCLLNTIPNSCIVYSDNKYTIYGAGKLYD